MPREKVERFAGPVIAEREHVADRARKATVRRLGGDGPPQTLEAAATVTVKSHGADPELIEWDAWRREDGRWLVRFAWAGDDEDSALFSFDPSGRTVVPEDDNARVVAGLPPVVPQEEPEPEIPTGPARLSVVDTPADDAAAGDGDVRLTPVASAPPVRALARDGDSAPDPMADTGEHEHTAPIPATAARRPRRNQRHGSRPDRRRREQELWNEQPPETTEDEQTSERLRLADIAQHVEETGEQPDLAPTADEPAPATRKPASGSSRSRRPSVPSWDEIMFGRRKNDQ